MTLNRREPGRLGPALSVSQVNRAIKNLLESSTRQLSVEGELGSWTRSRSNHCYFTLRDERAELNCVLFAGDAWRLPADPEVGERVRVLGRLTIYEARGAFQLVAQRLAAAGDEGLWRMAFNRLRAKLEAEGLLDPARKRALPSIPSTVAVVSSPSGAALRDVIAVVGRRAPWVRLLVSPAAVQGEGASEEIARAIEWAADLLPDLIVLCRGGGGAEDLWAFNREAVARAVANCPVPVVTGIGHEVDQTIADLVADRAAATPSAAAEVAVPELEQVLDWFAARRLGMRDALGSLLVSRHGRLRGQVLGLERAGRFVTEPLRRRVSRARFDLEVAGHRVVDPLQQRVSRLRFGLEAAGRSVAQPLRQRVSGARSDLEAAVRATAGRRRVELAGSSARLDSLSPLATLARGFSVARSPEGRVLKRCSDLPPGTRYSLRVSDGEVPSRVEESA